MARSTELFDRRYNLIIGAPRRSNITGPSPAIDLNSVLTRRLEGIFDNTVSVNTPVRPFVKEGEFIEINDLQIKATINRVKTDTSKTITPTTIEVYNLSESSQDFIKVGQLVNLTGGYVQDVDLPTIYIGEIMAVWTERKGTDTITTMICGDNVTPRDDIKISRSWPPDTSVDIVLTELLEELQRNGVPLGRPEIPPGDGAILGVTLLPSGLTVLGNIFDVISDVANEYNYRAYFVEGRFYVEPIYGPRLVETFVVEEENVKETIKPQQTKDQKNTIDFDGVTVRLFLDGRVKEYGRIQINSGRFEGTYVVKKVTHYLDYEGGWWETEVTADKEKRTS